MTRVLVTGVAGFIGAHFVEHVLANTDWQVIGIASFRHGGIPERLADSEIVRRAADRLEMITHDLRAPLSEIALGRLGEVDFIVHFAADSHVDRSIEQPRACIENNVSATLTVLEAARVLSPRMVVQISTDEVYGPARTGHAHKEWEAILPSNPYSASKACQEAAAFSFWRTFGVPVVVTNTMNNIGERQHPEKYVPMVIRRVLAGEEVTVHAVDGRVGSRFYLHARNHADGVLHLLSRFHPGADNGQSSRVVPAGRYRLPLYPDADRPLRMNIVGEREVDNLTIARRIAQILDRPLRYRLVDAHTSRPGHDLRYALDGGAMAAIGWQPPVGLDESLERTVRWYLQHPEWLAMRAG